MMEFANDFYDNNYRKFNNVRKDLRKLMQLPPGDVLQSERDNKTNIRIQVTLLLKIPFLEEEQKKFDG
eukprot:scaffold33255_cov70-Cyclotella_meneghiniana.AAC.1